MHFLDLRRVSTKSLPRGSLRQGLGRYCHDSFSFQLLADSRIPIRWRLRHEKDRTVDKSL